MRCLVALCVVALALPALASGFVVVTGAGGKTGKLVFGKLVNRSEPDTVRGVVTSPKSAKKLCSATGVSKDAVVVGDVLDRESLKAAFEGAESVVVCTSAVPKIKFFSILKLLFKKMILRKENPGRPEFRWRKNGEPELVDYKGLMNQVDMAKEAGVKQMVVVGSMGGTQPENFLNTIGKRPDGTGGDILLWKRKAEKYLIDSGLPYTIVHAGGLTDTEGGNRTLLMDVDDKLLSADERSIPRADVAEVCVRALGLPAAMNRAVDLASKTGEATEDVEGLWGLPVGNCDYSK
eukprot:CAMPEP_0198419306 /NCGR_PEP_ID=MMETSP1452-20131203/126_1 /TAXON_ID=1181717 /ORGANISM="Synchroma pusillum, Strain CCMP3072" /LENGTH=291 /DNA_ID=CAMNT_0044139431 /DNA_START=33 /DNA_END=908 /DNA_ORIENTATION=+